MILVSFAWYGKSKYLNCEVLDVNIVNQIPKCLDHLSDIDLNPTTSNQMKRKGSSSNINGFSNENKKSTRNPKKNISELTSESEDDDNNDENQKRTTNKPRESKKNSNNSNSSSKSKSNEVQEITSSFNSLSTEDVNLAEFSIMELYEKASHGDFPKKLFIFKDRTKSYCAKFHFFSSIRKFDVNWDDAIDQIAFKCKICEVKLHCLIGESTNLNQHLKIHSEYIAKWLSFYKKRKNNQKPKLDSNTLDLIRGVISANISLKTLENENFTRCLKMEISSVRTFRYDILPQVYEMMIKEIDNKLSNAITISFITDIWTNKIMADFLALGAVILNKYYQHEFLVIGMTSMSDMNHTSENIKKLLEKLINGYSFNKRLAHGKYIFTFKSNYYK